MSATDTIVALSSGALPAGVAVVRISGPQTKLVLESVAGGVPSPRRLVLRDIRLDGETIDRGLVAFMPGPHSFTGEDTAELQVHGSPASVRRLLRGLAALPDVRLATAGEFTRRAFAHGRLDLVEAQGLGDLITAETENQRALAFARMEGGLTRRLEGWRERLLDLRAEIEAQLDFSDEGDVGDLPPAFAAQVAQLRDDLAQVLAQRSQGRIMRSGYRVVLAGPPNVGKSSLLNALSQSDVAIVSDEPGTTRDLKEVPLDVNGQLILLIDSAGLRQTESKAEALGVDRALAAIDSADLVLWLQAPDVPRADPPFASNRESEMRRPVIVATKADLGSVEGADHVVSVASGEGIAALLESLYLASGAGAVRAADILVSHEQDRTALSGALAELSGVVDELDRPELAAERLRAASAFLERLLGRMDAESVLDRLFASFCIGK